jgi:hypothetical protein
MLLFNYWDFFSLSSKSKKGPVYGIESVNAYFADDHKSFEDFAWYHEVLGKIGNVTIIFRAVGGTHDQLLTDVVVTASRQ